MPHGDCDDEQPPPSASAPNEPTSAARHQHDDGNNNDKDDETAHRHDTSAASAHASATTDAALLAFVQAAAAAARTPPGPTANELGSVGSARHIAPPRGGGQPSALAEVTKTAAGDDNRKRGSGGARRRHDVTVDAELYCSFPVQAARRGMQRSSARRAGSEKVSAVGCSLLTRGGAGWRKRSSAQRLDSGRHTLNHSVKLPLLSFLQVRRLQSDAREEERAVPPVRREQNRRASLSRQGAPDGAPAHAACTAVPVATVCLGRV